MHLLLLYRFLMHTCLHKYIQKRAGSYTKRIYLNMYMYFSLPLAFMETKNRIYFIPKFYFIFLLIFFSLLFLVFSSPHAIS